MKLFDILRKPKNKAENEPAAVELTEAEPAIEAPEENLVPAAESAVVTPEESPEEVAEKVSEENSESADAAELTENFLLGLLSRMDSDANVEIASGASNTINVTLVGGQDPGRLIGRRGETLDAIQRITNGVVNRRGVESYYRIRIDAEGYHEKREEQLRAHAKRTASRVLKSRRSITMEPMNAFERHVIHETLQNFSGVSTHSTGSDPNRCVVVSYGNWKGGGKYGNR
ncbi:MAG: KH domain-containing protein [Oscillospiraceae bacterium]|jgi:spoIIIJ-associated protein|nr:KH domain-containing protein [Oscillospiraceae bacterium]